MARIPKRRRLERRTNYSKRRKLLEGRKPRIIARKTNRYIILQYVESRAAQDSVKVSVNSKTLLENGWPKEKEGSLKSIPAAYLTGMLFGSKIKKMQEGILDLGLERSTKGSRIYAAVKGINDAGAKVSCNPEMYPKNTEGKMKEIFDKVKSGISKQGGKA